MLAPPGPDLFVTSADNIICSWSRVVLDLIPVFPLETLFISIPDDSNVVISSISCLSLLSCSQSEQTHVSAFPNKQKAQIVEWIDFGLSEFFCGCCRTHCINIVFILIYKMLQTAVAPSVVILCVVSLGASAVFWLLQMHLTFPAL